MSNNTRQDIIKYYKVKNELENLRHEEYIIKLKLRAIGINVDDYDKHGNKKDNVK